MGNNVVNPGAPHLSTLTLDDVQTYGDMHPAALATFDEPVILAAIRVTLDRFQVRTAADRHHAACEVCQLLRQSRPFHA